MSHRPPEQVRRAVPAGMEISAVPVSLRCHPTDSPKGLRPSQAPAEPHGRHCSGPEVSACARLSPFRSQTCHEPSTSTSSAVKQQTPLRLSDMNGLTCVEPARRPILPLATFHPRVRSGLASLRERLAFPAQTCARKGVLWWAVHHRGPHRCSGIRKDLHGPVGQGSWWSHVGWVLSDPCVTYSAKASSGFGNDPDRVFLDRCRRIHLSIHGAGIPPMGMAPSLEGLAPLARSLAPSAVPRFHATSRIKDQHLSAAACRQGLHCGHQDVTWILSHGCRRLQVVRDTRPWLRDLKTEAGV